ncbi:MAG TPA: universal stress protein [Pseudonocardia sp.]
MPIVTGYEDTPGGHDALVLGAQLCRLTGLAALVATVHSTDVRRLTAAVEDPRYLLKTQQVARRRFAEAREFVGEGWGEIEPEFAELGPGPIPDVLSEYADEVGAAVLVVGSTGHGLLGRLSPGRTVQRLLPRANCPVAIAPRGYRHLASRSRTPSPIGVITVAYDASPEADHAIAVAVHLASRTGAVLRFVTVAETDDDIETATKTVHKGVAGVPAEMDTLADVVVGAVARTLADLPERTDLLVVGSRGYRVLRRVVLGGVAGSLVRNARYPVVIVPGLDE